MKVYIAGKVSANSIFGTDNWRDAFCTQLSQKWGYKIINLDPSKDPIGFFLDENNSQLIFGRDCFMISQADVVIVYLTNDISVGGSQEMLIAKHFGKPLIGIAQKGGKFNKEEKERKGRIYKNWQDPFVTMTCDKVVEDIEGVVIFLKNYFSGSKKVKDLSLISQSINYYKDNFYAKDTDLNHD